MDNRLSILLKPQWGVDSVNNLQCVVTFNTNIDNEEALLFMTMQAASIPCCKLRDLSVTDGQGEIPLTFKEAAGEQPHVKNGRWLAGRAVSGEVRVSYTADTRVLPPGYSSSPYFDFRDEAGGASGAGWTFMLLPAGDEDKKWDFSLTWDLSALPEGSSAITTLGDGDTVTGSAKTHELGFAYYAAGLLRRWEDAAYPQFGFYWFSEGKYDIAEVAAYTKGLYQYMSAFFGEPDRAYKVIARKDPFPVSGGGTALPGGFMYGYSDAMDITVDSIQNLLSHEMVHNWPHLHGGSEESTWYHEGAAEYYSSVLPYRAGLITAEKMAEQFNKKMQANYYLNLFRDMPNDEAAKIYWIDRESQRLPYGRGLVYLTNMDAWIREKSGGRHSLDDVVLELLKLQRSDTMQGVTSWLTVTEKLAEADPHPYYDEMKRGDLLIPHSDSLGGAFNIRRKKEPLLDVGFDMAATFKESGPYAIVGFKPGSNAAKAGLRGSDCFITPISRKEVLDRKTEELTLNVMRGGKEVSITYLPHGELADVWYYSSSLD